MQATPTTRRRPSHICNARWIPTAKRTGNSKTLKIYTVCGQWTLDNGYGIFSKILIIFHMKYDSENKHFEMKI